MASQVLDTLLSVSLASRGGFNGLEALPGNLQILGFWQSSWSALGLNREGRGAGCILVSLYVVMKQSDHKQPREQRGDSIPQGSTWSITEGSQGRHSNKNQEQKPRILRGLLAGSLSGSWLIGFLLQVRNTA